MPCALFTKAIQPMKSATPNVGSGSSFGTPPGITILPAKYEDSY